MNAEQAAGIGLGDVLGSGAPQWLIIAAVVALRVIALLPRLIAAAEFLVVVCSPERAERVIRWRSKHGPPDGPDP